MGNMFDEVQLGWLSSDDYERKAAADATPDSDEPQEYDGTGLPPTVALGRLTDDDHPSEDPSEDPR